MAKIHIKDLPKDMKISKDMMKQIRGGMKVRTTNSLVRLQSSLMRATEEQSGDGSVRFILK